MGQLTTLRNGAIYDMTIKRIVSNPGGGSTAITQAQASVMARSRWDAKRAAFERGIAAAIAETGMMPPGNDHTAAAWEVIGNKAATLLLDETNARNYASLLHEVRATVQDRDEPAIAAGAAAGAVAGVLNVIIAAIQQQRAAVLDADIAEAETRDADDVE